jgi:hypothetical protein
VICIFVLGKAVYADNFESERYRIQFGNISEGGENLSSSSYNLGVSLGQTAVGEFQSTGYIVKAGFQYIHSIIPFSFSISSTSINFGTLIPQTPSTQATTLTVSFGGAGQYLVTAVEKTPLKTISGNTIPNTSCDGGGNTCTVSTAKPWTSSSKYGFGYNMSGDDVPADFTNSTYYRPFPDESAAEDPETVMSSVNVGRSRQATATFKSNISGVQPAGSYHAIVQYTATGSY